MAEHETPKQNCKEKYICTLCRVHVLVCIRHIHMGIMRHVHVGIMRHVHVGIMRHVHVHVGIMRL